jgi:hypothetical protein
MNNLVTDYRTATDALRAAEREWNALPTREARAALHDNIDALTKAQGSAARALIADAAGRHRIEERGSMWLELEADGTWGIASATLDGYPLQGYDDGPLNEECVCDDEDECAALLDAVRLWLNLPTAEQLLPLLPAPEPTPREVPQTVVALLAEYAAWTDERAQITEDEYNGGGAPPRAWEASDDGAFDMLARFASAVAAEFPTAAPDVDTASSVSRQHFIDTGRYLTHAEVADL